MTLTRTQIHHRLDSLSGEMKAADAALTDCKQALAASERQVAIDGQAVERAAKRLDDLKAERARLAEDYAHAALSVGDPIAQDAPQSSEDARTDAPTLTLATRLAHGACPIDASVEDFAEEPRFSQAGVPLGEDDIPVTTPVTFENGEVRF